MLGVPIQDTRQILKQLGLLLRDMDIIERSEEFASIVLAWIKEMDEFAAQELYTNGCALASEHTLGATGYLLITKLLYKLEYAKVCNGFQVMCIGRGIAAATILERV